MVVRSYTLFTEIMGKNSKLEPQMRRQTHNFCKEGSGSHFTETMGQNWNPQMRRHTLLFPFLSYLGGAR